MTRLNLSCRFDRCVYNDEVCAIQNYKTGFKEPEPVAVNGQMKSEALIVAVNLQRAGITPKRFVVQLVTGPWGVMEAEFSYTELAAMYEEITGTLLQLQNEYAPLNPSPDACGFCPAILICQAVKDKIPPIKTLLRTSRITNYTTLDAKKLAQNLDEIKVLRDYFDEFETFCKNSLDETSKESRAKEGSVPFEIDGYAMVPGAEKRDWKNPEQFLSAQQTLIKLGISLEGVKTHTPASYEKLYAKHYGRPVAEIKESFKQLMEGLIEYSNNKPSLKRVKEIA